MAPILKFALRKIFKSSRSNRSQSFWMLSCTHHHKLIHLLHVNTRYSRASKALPADFSIKMRCESTCATANGVTLDRSLSPWLRSSFGCKSTKFNRRLIRRTLNICPSSLCSLRSEVVGRVAWTTRAKRPFHRTSGLSSLSLSLTWTLVSVSLNSKIQSVTFKSVENVCYAFVYLRLSNQFDSTHRKSQGSLWEKVRRCLSLLCRSTIERETLRRWVNMEFIK
jgi:hypothetical protein